MGETDFRFSISAEKYLEKFSVLVYIEDAIHQLLEHKDENPKVNTTKFLAEYFQSVRAGSHTLFREYTFLKATPHNRASFVSTFWKCFKNIGQKGDLLSCAEYHSLLCLLCSDFPMSPVEKTAKIILMDDRLDTPISFSDFLYAFQIQFCYDEFLTRSAEIYKELLKSKQNSHDPVYVPTSEEAGPRAHGDEGGEDGGSRPDGVDSMTFLRSLLPLCEQFDKMAPPLAILKDLLSSAERVTFYGYLMALAKSDRLNTAIGRLPLRADLLSHTEQELTSGNHCSNIKTTTATVQHDVTNKLKTASLPSTPTNQTVRAPLTTSSNLSSAVRSAPQLKSAKVQRRGQTKPVSSDSGDDTDDSSDTN